MYFIRIHLQTGAFLDKPYGHDPLTVRREHADVVRDPRKVKRVEMHGKEGLIETFWDSSWNTDRQIAATNYNQAVLWAQTSIEELAALAPLMSNPDLSGWDLLARRLSEMETTARNLSQYAEATKIGMGGG